MLTYRVVANRAPYSKGLDIERNGWIGHSPTVTFTFLVIHAWGFQITQIALVENFAVYA